MTGKIYKSIMFTKLYFLGENHRITCTSPHKLSIPQFLFIYIQVYKTKRLSKQILYKTY